ncbi:hypothetical protein LTR91_002841 [Friedmanniomyces endolithicus]|uniref:Fe2OG dioxygenase domain-containing protein n=1 Tax=Friedmanniomyces endolithicus TaxID=329885 RepID=A0AAN6L0X0_9PEZI|nr:hypothetical protein LTR94_011380 [Friedmanniomyces endolithicus]KAK0785835.1 hypothetical protein LTR59_010908 [Friedmanniomyces endolithicus]KAK0787717.1 hypothetical protein LTR38_011564 [Friedmanniomyces endolithicus]KAK0799118.1 hypothetical protein LTR75_009317 [Friedmanniomyces endolithicus]KAK0839773.1 hypothetical protein LTR03_011051 [Friedmanniomyces endolithicus]
MTVIPEIPTIDLSSYIRPDATPEERAGVIEDVRSACSRYGFLQVKGHGVPLATQREVLESCRRLFDLPQGVKDSLSLKNNPARRGYERIGEQILDAKALPDCKEGYYLGREVPLKQMGFLRGPNQWPDLPSEDFHAPVTEYYEHMLRLGNSLVEILALGLGHDISVLKDFTKEPVVNLKLLHYPKHISTDERQFGAGAHTDFGAITILLQQPGKYGLQIFHAPSNAWLPVPAIEDSLVINIGDLVNKWTDGKYNSTLHRVVNASDGDRYSVPCFYHGDLSATNPFKPGDGSETVEEHIRRKFDISYGLTSKS